MTLYRCRGVVLRTYKLGESDRIVSLVTDEQGKVRAVAKGVRKTKSRIGARLEPMSHVSLLVYQGRELDVISQAETIDHFKAIRDDLDRLTHANTLLEAIDAVAQERQPDAKLYEMLVGALRSLAERDSPLLVAAFFWKLLAHEGYRPSLDECVRCGSGARAMTGGPGVRSEGASAESSVLTGFDVAAGGVTCRSCTIGGRMEPATLGLLRRILGGGLASVLREPPSAATHEVDRLATVTLEHHLERRLRSTRIFERG